MAEDRQVAHEADRRHCSEMETSRRSADVVARWAGIELANSNWVQLITESLNDGILHYGDVQAMPTERS